MHEKCIKRGIDFYGFEFVKQKVILSKAFVIRGMTVPNKPLIERSPRYPFTVHVIPVVWQVDPTTGKADLALLCLMLHGKAYPGLSFLSVVYIMCITAIIMLLSIAGP